ncbi:MAG TPA: TonB C-terminal domain-containing protein [Stellaceae bacterium]|nr:TonB C-terminal domain-containing protein [Stellaceae bacterium]
MTLTETWDLPKLAISDVGLDEEDDRFTAIDIALDHDPDEVADAARFEPSLAASPFFIEFDEPTRLDPERAGLIWELVPASARSFELRSPLASLAFHLLPVLVMILLPLMVVEPPPPIPVQLVFEPPPPPPPPPPAPEPQQQQQPPPPQPKLESGRLSSVDMGMVKPNLDLGRAPDPLQLPSAGDPQQNPAETQTAAAVPPPPVPLPKPAPPKEKAPFQLPKPSGASVPHHEETPHAAVHSARVPGMSATRDEYLAYLVTLTRQHINLLPMSMVGDRRGETIISVVVYENGRIGPLGILRSSGYPDIDQRIEAMVAAVGKFPPLPQWYQGKVVQLELTLRFPEALAQ